MPRRKGGVGWAAVRAPRRRPVPSRPPQRPHGCPPSPRHRHLPRYSHQPRPPPRPAIQRSSVALCRRWMWQRPPPRWWDDGGLREGSGPTAAHDPLVLLNGERGWHMYCVGLRVLHVVLGRVLGLKSSYSVVQEVRIGRTWGVMAQKGTPTGSRTKTLQIGSHLARLTTRQSALRKALVLMRRAFARLARTCRPPARRPPCLGGCLLVRRRYESNRLPCR